MQYTSMPMSSSTHNGVSNSMMSGGVIAGLATLITSYLVKKFELEMTHYGILYSLLIAVFAWFKSIDITKEYSRLFKPQTQSIIRYPNGTEFARPDVKIDSISVGESNVFFRMYEGSKQFLIILFAIVIILYVAKRIWASLGKIKIHESSKKDHYKIEFHTPNTVMRVINFINSCPEIFGAKFDSMKGDQAMEFYYQQNYESCSRGGMEYSDLTFIRQLRDIFIPKIDAKLPFEIDEIGMKGRLSIINNTKNYTVTTLEGHKNERMEKQKSVFLISVILEITENEKNMSNTDLLTFMWDKLYEKETQTKKITLNHQKSYYTNGGRGVYDENFFKGEKDTIQNLEKIWIDPFFHPEKDRLWGLVKTIHASPETLIKMGQSPRASFLLHGPPGTGKSSFAFRVAMTLQYDICSLDIRHFDCKTRFEEVIRNCVEMGIDRVRRKKVIIFDEFDIGVRHLYRMEETQNLERDHLKKQIDHVYKKLETLETDYNAFAHEQFTKIKGKDKDSKNSKSTDSDNEDNNGTDSVTVTENKTLKSENSERESMPTLEVLVEKEPDVEDSKDLENAMIPDIVVADTSFATSTANAVTTQVDKKKTGNLKDDLRKSMRKSGPGKKCIPNYPYHEQDLRSPFYDSDFYDSDYMAPPYMRQKQTSSVYETTQMMKTAKEMTAALAKKETTITLKDLLTILQGPVPKSGCLIFATTNDYEEIRDMCPALFRHSRMTPIHFGYLDRKTLTDIFEYYFKRKPTFYVPEQTQNSSAEIIQYAMECMCLDNTTEDEKFNIFDNLVNKNIKST